MEVYGLKKHGFLIISFGKNKRYFLTHAGGILYVKISRKRKKEERGYGWIEIEPFFFFGGSFLYYFLYEPFFYYRYVIARIFLVFILLLYEIVF